MKISVLTTLLALCLLAFTANANSKSIEIDSAEVDNVEHIDSASKSAEENKVETDNADSNVEDSNDGDSDSKDDTDSKSAGEGIDLSDSKDVPESTVAPESSAATESTEVPETPAAPESTDAPESPEDPETTGVPESTEGPTEDPTTVVPDSHNLEVVNIEEMHRYVKDTMFMVEQMMFDVIDAVNESTAVPVDHKPTMVNIEEVRTYVKDLMSMVEQMMLSVIDKVSESMAALDDPEPRMVNIKEVRKHVKRLISMVEHKMLSIIDKVSESKDAADVHEPRMVNIEEVHRHIEHLISIVEHKMIFIIDILSKSNVIEHHHPRHNHHLPSHPGDSINIVEVEEEEKPVPIQSRTFKTLSWLLKSILKTLRGVNCTIKAVVNVKESTEQMLTNFHVCGVETTKQMQAALDSAQQVLSISNDIININENVCGNSDYLADVDASEKTSSKCIKQLRRKVRSLNKQISTTTKLVKNIPTDASDCVTTTFSNYQQAIVGFPDFVKACAKL